MPKVTSLSTVLADNEFVIGIDIGGTKLSIARLNCAGEVMEEPHVFPTPTGSPHSSLERALSLIESTIRDLIDRARAYGSVCQGIGIAAPGPTDPESGVLYLAPSLGWRNVPLRERLTQRFGLPARAANDVQAAALGELHFGWGNTEKSGLHIQNLFWMTVSTGIGGGVIIDGQIYGGNNGMAGEIGHLILDESGPTGPCGHAGCLESLASGPAIAARARTRAPNSDSRIIEIAGDASSITPSVLVAAARQGDRLALQLWEETGAYLGKAISYAINLLDPDIVVLGGGVVLGAGDLVMNPIINSAYKHAFDRDRLPPIKQTAHGARSGVVGAATLMLLSLGS